MPPGVQSLAVGTATDLTSEPEAFRGIYEEALGLGHFVVVYDAEFDHVRVSRISLGVDRHTGVVVVDYRLVSR